MIYFLKIISALAYYLPIMILSELLFYVLQIPFAAIHRYAVYAVMLIKLCFQCSFLSYMAIHITVNNNLEPLPFAIVFLLVIYFQQLHYFKTENNEASMQYGKIATFAFVPLFIITALVLPAGLASIYASYIELLESISLFSIGKILIYAVGGIYLFVTVAKTIIYALTIMKRQ